MRCLARPKADLATAESVSREIIEQALMEGRQRGLITVREISELRSRICGIRSHAIPDGSSAARAQDAETSSTTMMTGGAKSRISFILNFDPAFPIRQSARRTRSDWDRVAR